MTDRFYNEAEIKQKGETMPDYLSKKDKNYFLQWARYIFREYLFNRNTVGAGGYAASGKSFQTLRAYALGNQSPLMYMDILDKCEDKNIDKGFLNINWDVHKILPKFRDLVRGKMMDMEFTVKAQAIDPLANKERLTEVNKLKLLADPRIQQAFAQSGVQPDTKLPDGAESPEDIAILEKMGGLRLQYEIVIEDLIKSTFFDSKYETIKDKLIDDILDFNMCANRTYLDKKTGKVKVDYVNPINLVCKSSEYQDHRDIDFVGEIKRKTISQLRTETKLNEEQLASLANKYSSYIGNRNYNGHTAYMQNANERYGVNKYNYNRNYNTSYNSTVVEVFDFYFLASEAEDFIVGAMDDQEKSEMVTEMAEVADKYEKPGGITEEEQDDLARKEEEEGDGGVGVFQCVYHCQWIIGTDMVFDFGKEYGVTYEKKNGVKRALLPIRIYADRTPSLVERCIALVDDIQLAIYKKRNLLQALPPGPRLAIDVDGLQASVSLGGQQYDIRQLMNMYAKTGKFFYKSREVYNEEGGSRPPPIAPLQGVGITEDFMMLLQEIDHGINQIRSVTGINEVADGTSQNKDMLVSVQQGLNAATNTTLRPYFRVMELHKLSTCEYIALKWQIAVLSGDIDTAYIPIGDSNLKAVVATKDLYSYDFGINLVLAPSLEERQMLLQNLEQQKSQGQLETVDYLVIWSMVMAGDLKKAELHLAKCLERKKAADQQFQLAQTKAQGEANGQAAKMAEDAKAQNLLAEIEAKTQLEKVKGDEDRKTAQLIHTLKMEELKLTAGHQVVQTAVDSALNGEMPQNTGQPPAQTPQI